MHMWMHMARHLTVIVVVARSNWQLWWDSLLISIFFCIHHNEQWDDVRLENEDLSDSVETLEVITLLLWFCLVHWGGKHRAEQGLIASDSCGNWKQSVLMPESEIKSLMFSHLCIECGVWSWFACFLLVFNMFSNGIYCKTNNVWLHRDFYMEFNTSNHYGKPS